MQTETQNEIVEPIVTKWMNSEGKLFRIILVIGAVFIIGFAIGFLYKSNQILVNHTPPIPTNPPFAVPEPVYFEDVQSEDTSQLLSNDEKTAAKVYNSNQKNISFSVPADWSQVEVDSVVNLPPGAATPWIAFRAPNDNCVIAGGAVSTRLVPDDQSKPGSALYEQISYDGWYVPITPAETEKYSFVGQDRFPIPREVRIYSYFFAWSENGSVVSDKCAKAFEFIVRSINDYAATTTLDKIDKGVLSMRRFDIQSPDFLAITNTEGETFKLFDLPLVTYYHGRFTFAGNSIYAIKSHVYETNDFSENRVDKIIKIDPYTATTSIIFDSKELGGLYISSHLVIGHKLYFLAGDNEFASCIDGYKPCFADLYVYDMSTNEYNLVLSDIRAKFIFGYSERRDKIYLSDSNGDAGCFHHFVSELDVLTSNVKVAFDVGGCVEEQMPKDIVLFNEFSASINGRIVGGLKYENGNFVRSSLPAYDPYNSNANYEFYFAE